MRVRRDELSGCLQIALPSTAQPQRLELVAGWLITSGAFLKARGSWGASLEMQASSQVQACLCGEQ